MTYLAILPVVILLEGAVAASPNPDVLLPRARALALQGRVEEARKLYQQTFDEYNRRDDLAGQATIHVHLSDLAMKESKLPEAIELRKEAYRRFRNGGKGYSQAQTLREIALLEITRGDRARSTEMLEAAAPMFEYLEVPEKEYLTRALLLAILVGDTNIDIRRIVFQSRKLLTAKDPAPQLPLQAAANDCLGYVSMYLGDHQAALSHYEKALQMLGDGGDLPLLIESVQTNRAQALMYLGDFQEAARVYEELARKRKARGDERKVLSMINASVACSTWAT